MACEIKHTLCNRTPLLSKICIKLHYGDVANIANFIQCCQLRKYNFLKSVILLRKMYHFFTKIAILEKVS